MSDRPTVNLKDLPPEMRKRLGVRGRKARTMTLNQVRTHALRILAAVADLTPNERKRVLRHATKLNAL